METIALRHSALIVLRAVDLWSLPEDGYSVNGGSKMTFMAFMEKFPTEETAIDHFVAVRYGDLLTCPHCGATKGVYRQKKRIRYCECSNCNNSFSVFKGTIFEETKVEIRKWFYAIHLFLNDKKGVSACNLQREIGGSYTTSFRMEHQLRAAMGNLDIVDIFSSLVEADETYIGGKPRKYAPKRKRGRGTNKIPVLGILERSTHRVCARALFIEGPDEEDEGNRKLLSAFLIPHILKTTVRGTTVITDELKGYNPLVEEGYKHLSVNHSEGQYSAGNGVHTNTIENFWSILKRSIIGVYHKTSRKYLQRYVNEACFRRNSVRNDNTFDQLLRQAVVPEANNAWRVAS